MIQKLQRKFALLVLAGLLLITAGVVVSINYANWTSVCQQAKASLQTLSDSGGQRPGMRENHQGSTQNSEGVPGEAGQKEEPMERGQKFTPPGQPRSDMESRANLSNFYAVQLDHSGAVSRWFSDRSELYTDEQVQELAKQVQEEAQPFGRIGSQFYMVSSRPSGSFLVVLDARMELASAKNLLLTSSLVGVVSYLLMSLGAILLVRRMTRPVQEAFDKQKQFVWDASHELKTPLAVISANAEVLAGDYGENEWLGYIQSEVKRTSLLVQNLLTLARMDQGSVQVQRQPFDLGQAVLGVALPFESAVFEAGKTMELEVPDGLSYTGDEEMLKQLVVILLSNAMKYSNPGGVITLSLRRKGDRRVLRVHNTGQGLTPEELPRVFDRFYRVDRARNREAEGSGLGLAIAKTIVDAHKGKMIAESQEGAWACFTVTL